MKPTPDQKHQLKDYLYKVMRYRETYEEVYDHMLLAIENHPEQQYFATTMVNILESDFGGSNGLLELEESCKHAIETNSWAQYRLDFNRWFTSPLAIVTCMVFAFLFYMQFPVVKTGGALLLLFAFLIILHPLLAAVRGFKSGYTYGDRKTSIKDEIFRQITFSSLKMLWGISIFFNVLDAFTGYLYDFNITIGRIVAIVLICFFSWPYFRVFVLRKERTHKNAGFNPKFPITPVVWRIFLVLFIMELSSKYVYRTNNWPGEKQVPISIIYAIATGIMVLLIIHIFSVIKLYRSEFKTNMVAY